MLLILGCLNTEFRELLLLVFSFQIILLNDTFINMLKIISSIGLDHMRELSLSSNKILIILLLYFLA